jgi:hypothetical protein
MTSDQQDRPAPSPAVRRWPRRDLAVAGGALLYVLLGFLPWASVTYDVLGRISASGYGFSFLVPVAAVLLAAAAAWTLASAFGAPPVGFPRSAVTLGLAALAVLLTLVTWLRSTDYGVEPVPLLALLLSVAVAASAARSLRPEWDAPPSSPVAPSSAVEEAVPGGPPAGQH